MKGTGGNEKHYLFIFDDGTRYDMRCGISLKDAIWEMAKYTGDTCEMFRKALFGYPDENADELVRLYGMFGWRRIIAIYIIAEQLYEEEA